MFSPLVFPISLEAERQKLAKVPNPGGQKRKKVKDDLSQEMQRGNEFGQV